MLGDGPDGEFALDAALGQGQVMQVLDGDGGQADQGEQETHFGFGEGSGLVVEEVEEANPVAPDEEGGDEEAGDVEALVVGAEVWAQAWIGGQVFDEGGRIGLQELAQGGIMRQGVRRTERLIGHLAPAGQDDDPLGELVAGPGAVEVVEVNVLGLPAEAGVAAEGGQDVVVGLGHVQLGAGLVEMFGLGGGRRVVFGIFVSHGGSAPWFRFMMGYGPHPLTLSPHFGRGGDGWGCPHLLALPGPPARGEGGLPPAGG